ncbi:MAG TPA: hypothetical protein ENH11_06540 [Candidatus Acetothermia bacterium]|nr:hypothetical protein [Candidatus Acetothermia bacterium]
MRVTWAEQITPFVDTELPKASQYTARDGEVVGACRVLGKWQMLVYCNDGQFREVAVNDVTVVK